MNNIKFEQMLEYLINEETEKAQDLFHDIVVEKSREIYESLLDDDMNEVGGDESDEFVSDVEDSDEEFSDEGEESSDEFGDEGEESSDEFGGEGEESGDEPATKDDILDIKDALEDLKAEFEKLLSGEEESGESEETTEEGWEDDVDFGKFDEPDYGDETDEAFVREYVEKVGNDWDKNAMKGEKNSPNTKSTVAGKNDMGGTAGNIVSGGEGSEKGTAGGLASNKPQDIKSGNVNVPGGNAGKTGFKTKESGHGAEKKGSTESNTNVTSILKGQK